MTATAASADQTTGEAPAVLPSNSASERDENLPSDSTSEDKSEEPPPTVPKLYNHGAPSYSAVPTAVHSPLLNSLRRPSFTAGDPAAGADQQLSAVRGYDHLLVGDGSAVKDERRASVHQQFLGHAGGVTYDAPIGPLAMWEGAEAFPTLEAEAALNGGNKAFGPLNP